VAGHAPNPSVRASPGRDSSNRAHTSVRNPIDRREFLRLAGAAALVGALEGCTSRTPNPGGTPSAAATGTQPSSALTTTTTAASSAPASATTSATPAVSSAAQVADLDALAKALGSKLLRPADAGYLTASRLYSTRYDGVRPAAVAQCATTEDVQKCLAFIRATGMPVAARSGGHSYAGYSTTSGLVINVGPMKQVKATGANSATVGAGATLLDVYAGLAPQNRSVPGGSCPTVGITGSTLGGGVGVVARKYGLSCDAVTAIDLVTVDGQAIRCTENSEADLYWAHRGGGGGNFGIVTAIEFQTHATQSLTHFLVRWDWSHAHDVVTAWQEWLPTTPNELWSSLHIDGAGSSLDTPHVYASGVFVGSPAGLSPLLDSLQSASKAPMTTRYVQAGDYLSTMFVEGGCADLTTLECHRADIDPGGKLGREANASRSDFIASPLTSAGVDVLLAGIEKRRSLNLPGGSVLFDAYGGVINSIAPGDTAFVNRDKLACLQYVAPWAPSAPSSVVAANQAWLDGLYGQMRPYVSGYAYINYIDAKLADWQHAYYGANLARLTSVKAAADPTNLLAFAQGLPT
jgi:FAD/FMN-containing dehydrogenase